MTTKVTIELPVGSHAPMVKVFALQRGAHVQTEPQLLAVVERGQATEQYVHYEQDILIKEAFE
jgi:hypothetical protein